MFWIGKQLAQRHGKKRTKIFLYKKVEEQRDIDDDTEYLKHFKSTRNI